ncbi:MAG: DUF1684 domain-containing protein [Nonlabens sp.]|uniref:DUF1684 domain-containing protein n=1 Tax=Nonlabens sp. TaxID=1888209 RepID=UPI003EF13777
MKLFNSILFLILPLFLLAQDYKQESIDYQIELNADYKSENKSPLSPRDRDLFHALNFYNFNADYVVEARFEKAEKVEELVMKTTTERAPKYVRYGTLHFKIDGVECQLTVFQNPELNNSPDYHDYLFVPFKDFTNGDGSYGTGRYMELTAPLGEKVILNFNNTYNPYCAYRKGYSCPIPPLENHLEVAIPAGVKVGFR